MEALGIFFGLFDLVFFPSINSFFSFFIIDGRLERKRRDRKIWENSLEPRLPFPFINNFWNNYLLGTQKLLKGKEMPSRLKGFLKEKWSSTKRKEEIDSFPIDNCQHKEKAIVWKWMCDFFFFLNFFFFDPPLPHIFS